MEKLKKYWSLRNFILTLALLCIGFGIFCYSLLYNRNSIVDDIVLWLSVLFAIIMVAGNIFLVLRPLGKMNKKLKTINAKESSEELQLVDIREYQELTENFNANLKIFRDSAYYVEEIEKNNLQFKIENHESHPLLTSIYNLQKQMIKINEEAKQREWINEGLSQFVDILRSSEGNNLESLGRTIISQLVKYTKSSQAGLYIYDDKKENLKQIAFYAYNRDKYTKDLIPRGYGLLWQCLFEKKPIHLREIPKDYINIKSGLGGALPNSILIIPLLLENDTYGVIELASFNLYQDYEVEFIKRLAENISSTIAAAEVNEKTIHLLEESEYKTKELQEQEAQMRQNMEEMQSTQEEMERIQQEIMHKDYNIKALLDTSNDTFFAIDREYKIIVVNRTLREKYLRNGIDLREGVNIFDCIPVEQHDLWKARYDRCFSGESYTQEIESTNAEGEIVYLRGYYSAIFDDDNNVIGASVRSTDISEINNYNLQIMDLNKTIMQMKDEKLKNEKTLENYLKTESLMQESPKLMQARQEVREMIKKAKERKKDNKDDKKDK